MELALPVCPSSQSADAFKEASGGVGGGPNIERRLRPSCEMGSSIVDDTRAHGQSRTVMCYVVNLGGWHGVSSVNNKAEPTKQCKVPFIVCHALGCKFRSSFGSGEVESGS